MLMLSNRRTVWWLEVIGAVVVVTISLWLVFGDQFLARQSRVPYQGIILLTGLPAKYCPSHATVTVGPVSRPGASHQIKITDCRSIDFSQLTNLPANRQLIVKLPAALAFSVKTSPPESQSPTVAVRLGDINNDGVIDELDTQRIRDSLFQPVSNQELGKTDLDGDDQISAVDLAIVKNNFGVGATLPND